MKRIHVIHENAEWSAPLFAALDARGLPYADWFIDQGTRDLSVVPPEGVFYNRMSASSHTRDHRYAPELTMATLAWLEGHGRRVLNQTRALSLELSKAAQYAELERVGITTPRTILAVGKAALLEAARAFEEPIIVKPNRAGKGSGVMLVRDPNSLAERLEGPDYVEPVDGITLVQSYIEPPDPFITRVEFVGRELLYAVRVDTSEGFELCPADACAVGDAFCPTDGSEPSAQKAKFVIQPSFRHPFVERFQRFMENNGAHIAAYEFVVDRADEAYVYDVNMNVNYNSDAEALARKSGMGAIADYLGGELARS